MSILALQTQIQGLEATLGGLRRSVALVERGLGPVRGEQAAAPSGSEASERRKGTASCPP